MNQTLETCIEEMRELPEADQARFGEVLREMLADVQADRDSKSAMDDPAYRAYVEQSVAAGQADADAGRFLTLDEIERRVAERFKARGG